VELAVPSTTRVVTSRSACSSLAASQMSLDAACCSATSCCSLIQFPIVLDPRGSLYSWSRLVSVVIAYKTMSNCAMSTVKCTGLQRKRRWRECVSSITLQN